MESVFGGLIAASFAFFELKGATREKVSWRASHWVFARLAFDGLLAAGVYPVMERATGLSEWPTTLVPMILAGLAAPYALRSKMVLGRQTAEYGPVADRYQAWLATAAGKIDDIGSTAESNWVWGKVLPQLGVFTINDLRLRAVTYLRGRFHDDGRLEGYEIRIEEIAADGQSDDAQKRAVLVQTLLDLGGRQFVGGLARAARRYPSARTLGE